MIDLPKHFSANKILTGPEYLRQNSRDSTHLIVRWSAFLVSLFCITALFSLNAAAQPQPKRVLIVTGTNLSSPGFSVLQNLIAAASQASPNRVEFLFELQNGFLQPPASPDDDAKLVRYLREKYAGVKIDLIVVLVAARLGEVLKRDPELFKNVPRIIYDFEDDRDHLLKGLGPNATGVWTDLGVAQTWNLAHTLHPDARQLVVIAGSSIPEKALLERARVALVSYENKVKFTYLTNVTLDELKERVASLSKDDVIIFLTFSIDRENNKYTSLEVLKAVAPLSHAPIYGISDTQIGAGIVGGSLTDFQNIGLRLGEVMLRILAGEKAENIPPQTVPHIQKFDWHQLRRFGIDERNLPPNSIVQFRELTLWELYKWYIIGLVVAVIVEALLIIWLLWLRMRRRQAEAENTRLTKLTADAYKRLGEIVSNVPGIVWESRLDPVTKQRKPTFVSDHVQKVLGYTPQELLDQSADFGLQRVLSEDQERVKRDIEVVLSSGKDGLTEFRWTTKDEETVWVESYLSPMVDDDGKVAGVRGVTLDVSKRKQIEETLHQTEERSSAIVRAIPDLIFLQTLDGTYVECHAKNPTQLLVPRAEFIGKNMRDVLASNLTPKFLQAFERASENSEPQILEYKQAIANVDRWFEARIVRTSDSFLTVVRDITKRKSSEDALKKKQAELAGIIESAMDAIITVDETQRIVLFNNAAETIFNCPAPQAIGEQLDRFIPPPFREVDRKHITVFGRDSESSLSVGLQTDLMALRATGEEFPIEASVSHIKLGDEKFYTVILRDITKRKQAERTIREANAELSRLKNQLEAENIYLQEELQQDQVFAGIVGQSQAIKYVTYKINQVAATNATVLIMGDTGTGKELVARAIHDASSRRDRPLIKVNCAALSPTLIESELFGHEKGAFTGAGSRKLGRFELANSGSILLDEIGELPLDLQAKLLRVLQENELERVGGGQTIKVDVRVIAATNRNLRAEVDKGRFREDLWYRLNVFPITTPPLRERLDDIPVLVEHFVKTFRRKFGRQITSVSPTSMKALCEYSWPGNVRELGNVIERAVINSKGPVLRIHNDFQSIEVSSLTQNLKTLEEVERDYIIRILEEQHWRIHGPRGAARVLGMNSSTLRTRMVKLGIHRSDSHLATFPNGDH